jgi:hypothetical protein
MIIDYDDIADIGRHVRKNLHVYAPLALVLLVFIGMLILWSKADDAAIQSHENKAQQAEDKALNHEGRADASRDRGDAIEPQRVEAQRRVSEAKQRTAAGKVSLAQRRREYDEVQTNQSGIDRSGSLNDRERRNLSKLDQLYPEFGSVRSRTFNFED